jgi:CDP-diacylglycerol--serine O-phosphatidyltransferase
MPSPGAAAVVIATVFALARPDVTGLETNVGPAILIPAIISVVPALLMISTIRFRSFRSLVTPETPQARVTTAVTLLAVILGLIFVPAVTGLIVAYSYVATAPLGVITAPLRARIFGPDSVAPPRVRQQSVFLQLGD